MSTRAWVVVLSAACLSAILVAGAVYGNGGPFVIKYPEGDPAAKGVLARLDPDLRPGRIEGLRVVKEDLTFVFLPKEAARQYQGKAAKPTVVPAPTTPLVQVSAAYTIENPTDKEVAVDFGFPILRGVYVIQGMGAYPDVQVRLGKPDTDPDKREYIHPQMITNSVIYGVIRQRAREAIDKAVAADAALGKLAAAVKSAAAADRATAKKPLTTYLIGKLKWNERDAALMAEYAGLTIGEQPAWARDASPFWMWQGELRDLTLANLGPLAAIGEQKATQFFAQLANCFDPKAGAAYEAIFSAWGGDVREQSVDIKTGKLRPREISVDPKKPAPDPRGYGDATVGSDPTVYARVDYLDETANITDEQKAACRAILKNLPVVFTFAPMNLLHYQAKFPAKSTVVLTVSYRQYAYADTADPASCQMAYVLHPASMWNQFGPINLEVRVPAGVPFRASVETKTDAAAAQQGQPVTPSMPDPQPAFNADAHRATIQQKTGELFLAVETAGWDKTAPPSPVQVELLNGGGMGLTGMDATIAPGDLTIQGGSITLSEGALTVSLPSTQPEKP